jgi:hypothetical protein
MLFRTGAVPILLCAKFVERIARLSTLLDEASPA